MALKFLFGGVRGQRRENWLENNSCWDDKAMKGGYESLGDGRTSEGFCQDRKQIDVHEKKADQSTWALARLHVNSRLEERLILLLFL